VAWLNVGGYLGSALLVLGVLGVVSTGRRGLRIVLCLWILFMVACMYRAPALLGDVVNLLPGMSNAAVFRYSSASVAFAAVVLAAFGLDALVAAEKSRRRLIAIAAGVLAIIAVAALVAHSLTSQLGPMYAQHPYFAASVAWAIAVVVLTAATGWPRRARMRAALAAALLAGDAFIMFVVPQFSAPRAVSVDTAPVAYLRQHLGLQRYFTLGPFAPNYGSYYGLASLNAVDVPVPTRFQHYVNRSLDQAVDPTTFVGSTQGGRPPSAPPPAVELVDNLRGYQDSAVAYVLTHPGQALQTGKGFGLTLVDRTPTTWIYHLAGAASYMSAADPACSVTADSPDLGPHHMCPRHARHQARNRNARLDRHDRWTQNNHPPSRRHLSGHRRARGSHRIAFSYGPPYVGCGALAFVVGAVELFAPWGMRRPARCLTVNRATPPRV
jgi:hypothetical protein